MYVGFVYTEEPVVRSFSSGDRLVLNVHISAQYITSLAWYHNGTKLSSGNKYRITNNVTRLSVSDMAESDAGVYEVKINSISSDYGINDDPNCDSLVLPLLESLAAHAPVTFTVQEHCLPEYDPHSIVSAYYITESDVDNGYSINLRSEVQLNVTATAIIDLPYYDYWFRNGTQFYDGNMYNLTATSQELSLQIMSNYTADVIGDYVGVLSTRIYHIYDLCIEYYYYWIFEFSFSQIPLKLSFWSVNLYSELLSMCICISIHSWCCIGPPSSVLLHFREPVLTELESTVVECTAVGGDPPEAINLTLWWNEELVAHVNGSHLSYSTSPYPYGTYRCSVGDVHNTSILLERGECIN